VRAASAAAAAEADLAELAATITVLSSAVADPSLRAAGAQAAGTAAAASRVQGATVTIFMQASNAGLDADEALRLLRQLLAFGQPPNNALSQALYQLQLRGASGIRGTSGVDGNGAGGGVERRSRGGGEPSGNEARGGGAAQGGGGNTNNNRGANGGGGSRR